MGIRKTKDKCHILLVEDDTDICEAVAEVLRQEGYSVECASNGQQAWEKLHTTVKPHVILLDLSMPVKSGYEFRREQEQHPTFANIPVIIMSADSDGEAKKLRDHGVDYLKKPFEVNTLLKLVERYCLC